MAPLHRPFADAAMMSLHLAETSIRVTPGAHAIMVLDGAGWQQPGDTLYMPDTLTLLRLSPYSLDLTSLRPSGPGCAATR